MLDVRHQAESNWNIGSLAGSSEVKDMIVETRIHLAADGTIVGMEIPNDEPGNQTFQQLAASIKRALMVSSPLDLHGRTFSSLRMRFHPGKVLD